MESQAKPRGLFLKFLPKPASLATFQSHPFSPGRDHNHNHNHHHHHHSASKIKAHAHKGFSGPIIFSALPDEARSRAKSDRAGFDAQEPTSPKVSCMGQIKYKHKNKKKDITIIKAKDNDVTTSSNNHHDNNNNKEYAKSKQVKKSSSALSKFFSRSSKPSSMIKRSNGSSSSDHVKDGKLAAPDHKRVPSLGHMRKFASGRETLANFDWTAQIAPIDHDRDCFSDDDQRRRLGSDDDDDYDDNEHDYDEDKEIIIPHSAPILVGGRGGVLGLEPRKEVNLWKRRTLAPPPPLALNSKVRS